MSTLQFQKHLNWVSSKPAAAQRPSRGITIFRFIVILLSLIAIGLGISSAIWAGTSITGLPENAGTTVSLLAYARLLGSVTLAIVFAFYLLSFVKGVALQDTRFERDLERFALDIDRASWVIETVMEFKDEEEGLAVPDEWLRGATARLFGNQKADEDESEKAMDALAELLSASAKLKIGSGGAEFEIDRKGLKKIVE